MKKNSWHTIRLLLIVILAGFLYAFSVQRNDRRYLKKIEVVFSDASNLLISNDVVNKLLIENNSSVKSIRKEKVVLNRLEKRIDSHKMVEKSEVFLTIDGTLKAVVKQKTPVARVFDETGSFYIDYNGGRVPLSETFTARVPLVTGTIHQQNLSKLTDVLKLIFEDPFLKKNIISIEVFSNGYMRMKNRNHDYVIEFGGAFNALEKFNNYKAFLQNITVDSIFYRYKKINLTYNRQVVCSK
jgi:cell division protein FtsQ